MKDIISITNTESKILALFTKDYNQKISILQLSKQLKMHYPNIHKTIKKLEKKQIISLETIGKASICSLNTKSRELPIYLSFVEELKAKEYMNKFPFLKRILEQAKKISSITCIGLFGSQITNKATSNSDIDMFILTEDNKLYKDFIPKYFPELENKIDLNIITFKEFTESLKESKVTISTEIAKNKIIISGAEIFYQIIQEDYNERYRP